MGGPGSGRRPGPNARPLPEWKRSYHTNRWQKRRTHQLRQHPICELCAQNGLAVAATIADHHPPHRGDMRQFWLGPLRSLCRQCHDGPARRGWSPDVDPVSGWPLDARHPCYGDDKDAPPQVVPEIREEDPATET
jgi:5-methylcytosine-specific restriction protein A